MCVSAERGRVFLTLYSSSLVLPQTSFSLPLRFLWPPRASSPPSRRRTAEGPGRCWWGRRSGEVGRVSCSPFLPFYRFMGAQSFSKYLPFPLYCGRLMAFDVRGARGAGAQVVGMAGGLRERMDRWRPSSGSRLPVPFDASSLAFSCRGRREQAFSGSWIQ